MTMVEWKKLGDICSIVRGNRVTKSDLVEDGIYPVISGGVSPLGYINRFNREPNTITMAQYGSAGYVDLQKEKFWANDVCYSFSPKNCIFNKYLYYTLKNLQREIYSMRTNAVPAQLPLKKLSELKIPIPSLSDQRRIVTILDTFTSAIDNLKDQIAFRRKQYEYYRNQLLALEGKEDKDIKCWGDFCKITRGNGVQKANFEEKGKGCIHYGQIYTYYGSYTHTTNKNIPIEIYDKAIKASTGDLIMTDTSENVEDICKTVAYLGKDDIAVSNHTFVIKHKQNPKFLSFSTQTKGFLNQKRQFVVGAKVSCIKQTLLEQIKIYLPSLQEQHRIVAILDTFEASIANLEAQLKEREKQYEYYRNKLLTFE